MSWFSRDDVVAQLRSLGYQNVPDDVLQDFMRDLVELDQQQSVGADSADALSDSDWRREEIQQMNSSQRSSQRRPRRKVAGDINDGNYPGVNDDFVLAMFDQMEKMTFEDQALMDLETGSLFSEEAGDVPVQHVPQVGDDCCPRIAKSVIRPRSTKRAPKTDIVRRGEQYRAAWDVNRAPGEKSHSKLRRQVHEDVRKSKPHKKAPLKKLEPNRYVVPTSKKRMPLRWAVREHLQHMT